MPGMKTSPKDVHWQWLFPMGIFLILFVVSLPAIIVDGVRLNLYGFPVPDWYLLGTMLSLGGFFISAFLFLKNIYL